MKTIFVSMVLTLSSAFAMALPAGNVQPEGWCDVAPFLPFCAAWR
ncbi:hypothetical protein [Tessaracoccus sp. OS52]|nr:hypothetical protein [Tessaracoccus sp. OS52]